jgi:hypothetical protein
MIMSLVWNYLLLGYVIHLNRMSDCPLGFKDSVGDFIDWKWAILLWPGVVYERWLLSDSDSEFKHTGLFIDDEEDLDE